ncbi:hypothetical protein P9239_20920 [Caballeronia sp. LZ062]|uniref:hypothetical protein n=1 Tax=unclassified Caballeronia TaxID=2646786 RepID=UPI002866847B|nr:MULTISPECIES: hypothetical protein [unclassified Caballeronia]MDR5856139.1 hypothetical protein [Caballeronia sp. LZ050]MDR5872810.1 hypothetical protein [Caballeronia sp. LZ062]
MRVSVVAVSPPAALTALLRLALQREQPDWHSECIRKLDRDTMNNLRCGAKTVNEAIGDTVKMLHQIGL